MDQQIRQILESSEQVTWQGKINRTVLILGLVFALIVVGVISFYFFSQDNLAFTSDKGNVTNVSGTLLGYIVVIVGILFSLIGFARKYVIEYAVTNKRVIVKSGIIGTDFKSVYYDQMKNVLVSVGIIGKIFKVGTVKIDTGKISVNQSRGDNGHSRSSSKTVYDRLQDIETPYEVFKMVQSSLSGRKEGLYSGRADTETLEKK